MALPAISTNDNGDQHVLGCTLSHVRCNGVCNLAESGRLAARIFDCTPLQSHILLNHLHFLLHSYGIYGFL